MSFLSVLGMEKKIKIDEYKNILVNLQENDILVESPCGGKGTCGKCKIKILEGKVNNPTEEELRYLTDKELNEGIRLGCLTKAEGNVHIELLNKKNVKHKILTEGYMPHIEIKPLINKKCIVVQKPDFENNISYEEMLEKTIEEIENSCISNKNKKDVLEELDENIKLQILRNLPEIFEKEEATIVYHCGDVIGVEAGDTTKESYGIAVDIGTTTVVASLVDLIKGEEIASESEINPQKEYGLDVLSRVDYVKTNEEGLERLHRTIILCINDLIEKLCDNNNIKKNRVYEVSIAANATMMHLLLRVNTNSIGKAPYTTVFCREQNISSSALGINIASFGRVYCLPGVSSYIGADIAAGAVVAGLEKTDKNVLFIDIGTNGEIVLSKKGNLSSCSCAAGPALEGMNISCGMRAADGAVEGVHINKDEIELKVIGDENAVGICGSGILEALSEIVRVKLVGKTGRIKKKSDIENDENLRYLSQNLIEEDKKRKIVLTQSKGNEISITQNDIRQVQLAKGAILSGFYALLELMELDMNELDGVVIAGQFGKHLSVESLIGVGIIPEVLRDRVTYIGNSSKTGALMCLLSLQCRNNMEQTAKKIDYFELSTKEGYERLFTKCLNF